MTAGLVERRVLQRSFEVDAPLEVAWSQLADLRSWPSWAPHIAAVEVEPEGPLGPSSAGTLYLRIGVRMRATFRMTTWEPQRRWTWVGRAGGLTVHYDHEFEPLADGRTQLTWTVSLSGLGSRVARVPFGLVYGRNVDRAITRLRAQLSPPRPRSG